MLNTTLRTDMLDFLTPLPIMQTEDSRRAALYAAGLDAILRQTDLRGSPRDAVAAIVYALEQYGAIDGEPALAVFLRDVATTVGTDKQARIQEWCTALTAAQNQPAAAKAFEAAPASAARQIAAQNDYFERIEGQVFTGPVTIYQGTSPPDQEQAALNQPGKVWDVFVCYAREDLERARVLYAALREAGVKPWLAYEDILPGQDWEYEIEQALTRSRYVLALLSSHSVSRKGFIQKELAHALDVVSGLPPSSIFLIPARLDACEPLDGRLQRLHWVDLFPEYEDGLRRILRVLQPETTPQPTPEPSAPKLAAPQTPRVVLRREPKTVDVKNAAREFEMDGWRPREYVQNQYEVQGEVVVDHATGLMWQRSGSEVLMPFSQAQGYLDELNDRKFAGHSGWRLPTVPELMSLLEPTKKKGGQYIDPVFDNTQRWCWSCDLQIKDEGSPSAAWGVYFLDGLVDWDDLHGKFYVRAVRS